MDSFGRMCALAACLAVSMIGAPQAAEEVEVCAKVRQSDGSWSNKIQLFGHYLTRDERAGIDGRRVMNPNAVFLHIYWDDVNKNTFIEMQRQNGRLDDSYMDEYTDEEGYRWRMRSGWGDC